MNHLVTSRLLRLLGGCGTGICIAAFLCSGCGQNTEADAQKTAPLPADAQIKSIQSNPAMPEAAKQQAMQSIQQHQAGADAMRAAAAKNNK